MEQKDNHFEKIFLYVCSTTGIVLLYVILITFLDIPEKNQRFVDIALAFLLGRVATNDGYLTGGSPAQQKPKPTTPGTTTADINITANTTTEDAPKNI